VSVDFVPVGEAQSPQASDAVFERAGDGVRVLFNGFEPDAHNYGLLLFKADGQPLNINYAKETAVRFEGGRGEVLIPHAPDARAGWLMVDTGVAASGALGAS
jgi:hypothetical protein